MTMPQPRVPTRHFKVMEPALNSVPGCRGGREVVGDAWWGGGAGGGHAWWRARELARRRSPDVRRGCEPDWSHTATPGSDPPWSGVRPPEGNNTVAASGACSSSGAPSPASAGAVPSRVETGGGGFTGVSSASAAAGSGGGPGAFDAVPEPPGP